jgi:cytochrome c oxidase subunit 2
MKNLRVCLLNITSLFFVTPILIMDYAEPFQMLFQDPATPVMQGVINLHHDIMFILIVITVLVTWLLFRSVYLFKNNQFPMNFSHGESIEIL